MNSDRIRRKSSQFSRDQTLGRSISKVKTVFLLEHPLFLTCRTCFRSTKSWLNQHTLRASPRLTTLFLDQHLFLSRETRHMSLKLITPFFDDCASSPGSRQWSLLIFATLIFSHEKHHCHLQSCQLSIDDMIVHNLLRGLFTSMTVTLSEPHNKFENSLFSMLIPGSCTDSSECLITEPGARVSQSEIKSMT